MSYRYSNHLLDASEIREEDVLQTRKLGLIMDSTAQNAPLVSLCHLDAPSDNKPDNICDACFLWNLDFHCESVIRSCAKTYLNDRHSSLIARSSKAFHPADAKQSGGH